MVRLYQALIKPNVIGGNIPVKIYANSVSRARDLIQNYRIFKALLTHPER